MEKLVKTLKVMDPKQFSDLKKNRENSNKQHQEKTRENTQEIL